MTVINKMSARYSRKNVHPQFQVLFVYENGLYDVEIRPSELVQAESNQTKNI